MIWKLIFFSSFLPYICSVLTEMPADTIVARGQPAVIHCSAYDTAGTGTVFISWKHNNTAINAGGRFLIYPNGTLELKSTQDEDEGSYSCTATIVNSMGTVTNTQTPSAASLRFACKYSLGLIFFILPEFINFQESMYFGMLMSLTKLQ